MRQALADTAATGQDDRPAAGGDVDMVDQGAAAPDPQVPTGVSLSKAQNESLAKMTGERANTSAPCCQELDFTFMSEAHAARSARTRWLRPACTRACPFTAPPGQAHASDCHLPTQSWCSHAQPLA